MMSFFAASENFPFALAIAVMIGIALLEGITSAFGAGLSSLLDTLIPEFDVDIDTSGPEVQTPAPLSRLLGWLRVGQVPILMLLVIFLSGFGLSGLFIQSIAHTSIGYLLPAWMASVPALIMAMPVVRLLGGLLERFMPRDETEAVSSDSFIGRIAIITLGNATKGHAAQAKVKDEHGYSHYVMVEPDTIEDNFSQGEEVLLVRKQGILFHAIKNTNAVLSEKQQ